MKNDFISSVSHELRTPLTSIKGWVETIGNIDDPTDKNYQRGLSVIGTETDRLYTMVEELAPDGYLVAESITFKVMQMNDALVVFIWQDGGWQKSSEGYLAMYDERTDTPVPLMKTFPQTGSIL